MFLCLSLYNFIFQVPGFPLWFNVKYDEDDAIYTFKLQEDVERGGSPDPDTITVITVVK